MEHHPHGSVTPTPEEAACRPSSAALMADQFGAIKAGVRCAVPRSAVEAGPAAHRPGEVAVY